jgi:hypothetical protein
MAQDEDAEGSIIVFRELPEFFYQFAGFTGAWSLITGRRRAVVPCLPPPRSPGKTFSMAV